MLASNESFFPPLPAAVEAAQRVIAGANRYPDPSYSALRAALADRYGVPAERIALGNGSCDILLAAGEALLEPGAELVYAWPAFSVYPHLAAASGARAIQVPLDADDRHDLDAMLAEVTVATRLVLICNPNNPTSTAIGLDQVERFLERVPRERVRDPRRGVRRVLADARRPVRVTRACCGGSRTWCCCGRSRRCTAWRRCGSDTRCAGRSTSGSPSTRCASRSISGSARRPPRSRRFATRTRSSGASSSRSRTGCRSRGPCEGSELWVADSDANFIWVRLPEEAEEEDVVRGLAAAAGAGPGREVARARRRAAGDGRHRGPRTSASSRRWQEILG